MNPTLRNATTPLCEDRLEHLPSWLRYEHSRNDVDCYIAVCKLNRQPGMVLLPCQCTHGCLGHCRGRQLIRLTGVTLLHFFFASFTFRKPYFETLKVKL